MDNCLLEFKQKLKNFEFDLLDTATLMALQDTRNKLQLYMDSNNIVDTQAIELLAQYNTVIKQTQRALL